MGHGHGPGARWVMGQLAMGHMVHGARWAIGQVDHWARWSMEAVVSPQFAGCFLALSTFTLSSYLPLDPSAIATLIHKALSDRNYMWHILAITQASCYSKSQSLSPRVNLLFHCHLFLPLAQSQSLFLNFY